MTIQGDMHMEARNETTLAEKNAFRRAFVDAMKSMATVVAYVFAADYIQFKPHASAMGAVICSVAAFALGSVAAFGAVFTVDLLMTAIHDRFPHIRNRKAVFFIVALLATIIATLPMYVRNFH